MEAEDLADIRSGWVSWNKETSAILITIYRYKQYSDKYIKAT